MSEQKHRKKKSRSAKAEAEPAGDELRYEMQLKATICLILIAIDRVFVCVCSADGAVKALLTSTAGGVDDGVSRGVSSRSRKKKSRPVDVGQVR
jgi:hypothetical protein